MAAVVTDIVDEVTYALCDDCADTYVIRDGWQGLCAPCCARLDDHRDRRHELNPIAVCRACDVTEERVELPAIA